MVCLLVVVVGVVVADSFVLQRIEDAIDMPNHKCRYYYSNENEWSWGVT